MNLYKISQDCNDDWDTFDSAIVCAESEEDAQKMHPGGGVNTQHRQRINRTNWAPISKVKVELIGTAVLSIPVGVVLASFNAG